MILQDERRDGITDMNTVERMYLCRRTEGAAISPCNTNRSGFAFARVGSA